MDYYKRKTRASILMETSLKNGLINTISELILLIEKEFGLGDKFVLSRLENLEKSGFLEIKGNTLKWV